VKVDGTNGGKLALGCLRGGDGRNKEQKMLAWALAFLVIAIIAAVLGFGGVAGTAAWVAKVLFVVFLILFVVSLFMGRRRPPV